MWPLVFCVSPELSYKKKTLSNKRAQAVFLSFFFAFFRAERALYFQASVGNNRHYIRTTKCRENNRRIVHTEVRTRSHTCIFTFLCACRVVVGHAKKEREIVKDTYARTAPEVYETGQLRRDIQAIIR